MLRLLIFPFLIIATLANSQRKDFHPNMAPYTTVRIVGYKDYQIDGRKVLKVSTGTGFFYNFQVDTSFITVIVTNYHVIKGCRIGELSFTENTKYELGKMNKFNTLKIYNYEKKWMIHPDEDLAILPIDSISLEYQNKFGNGMRMVHFDKMSIPTLNDSIKISDVEKVIMIGYPKGLWDSINNLPVIRQGITATSFFSDFNGRKRFLVDIPTFEGSSGSPILQYTFDPYFEGKEWLNGDGFRTHLLGIAVESYRYSASGTLISSNNDSTYNSYKVITDIPFNIAIAIKSEKLYDFIPMLRKYLHSKKIK